MVACDQLTEYVLESGANPLPYVTVLDGAGATEAIRQAMQQRAAAHQRWWAAAPHVACECLRLSARTPTRGVTASYRVCPSLAGGRRR